MYYLCVSVSVHCTLKCTTIQLKINLLFQKISLYFEGEKLNMIDQIKIFSFVLIIVQGRIEFYSNKVFYYSNIIDNYVRQPFNPDCPPWDHFIPELHLAPGAPWLCEDSQGRHPRDSAGREGPCRVPSPWCATVVLFYPIKSTHF